MTKFEYWHRWWFWTVVVFIAARWLLIQPIINAIHDLKK